MVDDRGKSSTWPINKETSRCHLTLISSEIKGWIGELIMAIWVMYSGVMSLPEELL